MSHLQYFSYPGVGVQHREAFKYSQAVRVGDRIECAGQGGWDPETGVMPADAIGQIDQAFANVELILKTAGGKGWSQVYRINSYHVGIDMDVLQALVRNVEKYMPGHCPLWTPVGVATLALPEMKVELEVVAHVGE